MTTKQKRNNFKITVKSKTHFSRKKIFRSESINETFSRMMSRRHITFSVRSLVYARCNVQLLKKEESNCKAAQYGVYFIYAGVYFNHSTENQIRNLYKKLTFTKVETTQV